MLCFLLISLLVIVILQNVGYLLRIEANLKGFFEKSNSEQDIH